jgi:shikimate dehydrogenase
MNLVLIGMPGCGKSTVGELAAKQLNMEFVDTDVLIEKREGRTISEIFATDGEEYFRKLESDVVSELATQLSFPRRRESLPNTNAGIIISVGGGAPMFAENVEPMKTIGEIVLIDRPIGLIDEGVTYNDDRPLLTDNEKLHELFELRMPFYKQIADKVIVNDQEINDAVDILTTYIQLDNENEKDAGSRVAVIGNPIGHSLSPKLHEAVYRMLGIDASYSAIRVGASAINEVISALRAGNLIGINVTIPHKQAIIPYLDEIKGDAETSGAVNTVVNRNGKLIGYNTDMEGLKLALASKGVTYKGKNVVVLGSGGAASGIAKKAFDEDASSVTLVSRNAESKLDSGTTPRMTVAYVNRDFASHRHPVRSEAESQDPVLALDLTLASADILINATPLGMSGSSKEFADFAFLNKLKQGAFVCDLVYNPSETALLREAKYRGFDVMNGLPMLIYQGILSDELFFDEETSTKINIEREKLFATVFESLSNAL